MGAQTFLYHLFGGDIDAAAAPPVGVGRHAKQIEHVRQGGQARPGGVHPYPQVVVFHKRAVAVAAGGLYGRLAKENGRMVERRTELDGRIDGRRTTAYGCLRGGVVRELADGTAHDVPLRLGLDKRPLPFKALRQGDVVAVHTRHPFVGAMPQAFVQGRAEPPVFGQGHANPIWKNLPVMPQDVMQFRCQRAVLDQHDFGRQDGLTHQDAFQGLGQTGCLFAGIDGNEQGERPDLRHSLIV